MALDLETLGKEMATHLEKSGMAVFHGQHQMMDSLIPVTWDAKGHPDFREYLETAQKAGAKLVVFHRESFDLEQIDDALEELETSDFTREEKKHYEARLRQLQAYEGFTCALHLSFVLDNRVYQFELSTDWYESMNDILGEIDAAQAEFEDEEEGPIGGYFSNN